MKEHDVATILWAIRKSISIMIREIDKKAPDLAKKRAEITITAIDKVLGTEECQRPNAVFP
jgi:hypothetical protein